MELLAKDYIPELCTALKRKNPLITAVAIRATVIRDVSKPNGPWKESTIRQYWPNWMKNPKAIEAGNKGKAGEMQARELREKAKSFGLSEQEIEKEEEAIPVKSWTLAEYEEEQNWKENVQNWNENLFQDISRMKFLNVNKIDVQCVMTNSFIRTLIILMEIDQIINLQIVKHHVQIVMN